MGKDKRFLGDKGMALITVLLMAGIIVLMTTSMVYLSTSYMGNVGNLEEKTKALKAAEAGIEYAIYRLDEEPSWGCTGLSFSGSVPTFSPDTGAGESIDVSNDSKFTITFGGSSYVSVNNMFNPNSNGNVPAYTAKIISVGQSGTSKKILEAHLVRSDYYPNTLTSGGRVILHQGNYTVQGEIYSGTTPAPGNIVSSWRNTPITGEFFGIKFNNDVQSIKSNGGTFVSNGPIENVASSMSTPPDGLLRGNYPKNPYYNKIDVKNILAMVEPTFPSKISPGLVQLIDPTPVSFFWGEIAPDPEISKLTVDTTTGFDGVVTALNDTITLNQDIYIDGSQTSVDSDKDKEFVELVEPLPLGVKPNVFRVYVNTSYSDSVSYGSAPTPDPPDPAFTPYGQSTPGDSKGRRIKLNLNGHNIYSNSHLILGVELTGQGKIISNGKIDCLLGVDPNQVIIMSNSDLKMEFSDKVSESRNKGFYYASDDISLEPLNAASLLNAAPPPGGAIASKEYPPGCKFHTGGPTPQTVTVGKYVVPPTPDPHGNHHDDGWRRDYEGASMVVKKVLIDGNASHYKIVAGKDDYSWGDFWISLDEKGKANVYIGSNKIQILMSPTPIAQIVDANGVVQTIPTPLDAADMVFIAEQFKSQFGVVGKNHYIKGTLVGLNSYPAYNSNHTENDCKLDSGSTGGFLTISENPSYMLDIMNLQRTNFKVRLVSCYEIK